MPRKQAKAPRSERLEIDGHQVEIQGEGDAQELRIDGVRRRFFRTSGGYVLHDDAFVPAQKTLLDAVRDHLGRATERRKPS